MLCYICDWSGKWDILTNELFMVDLLNEFGLTYNFSVENAVGEYDTRMRHLINLHVIVHGP